MPSSRRRKHAGGRSSCRRFHRFSSESKIRQAHRYCRGPARALLRRLRILSMKTSLIQRAILVAALAWGFQAAFAKVINYNQLPAAVQREAQTELKNGPVKQVQSLEQNGKTIYEIT